MAEPIGLLKVQQLIQPRYPTYLREPNSVEELVPDAARALERRTGRGALGTVEPGDRLLIIAPDEPIQDPRVLEAVRIAFREKQIPVTTVRESELGITPPGGEMAHVSALDGWKEIMWRIENTNMLRPEIARQRPDFSAVSNRRKIKEFLDKHPEFTAVIAGHGGRRLYAMAMREHGPKFKTNWIYYTYEDLRSKVSDFPTDVWEYIEDKTIEPLKLAEEVLIRDLQGTEVWFRLTPEEAALWHAGAFLTGHLFMYPLGARCFNGGTKHKGSQAGVGDPDPSRWVFPKAEGVIAGTSNHVGFFPHMQVYISGGVVTRFEGGGLFGELARTILAKTKDIQFPYMPAPGYLYLMEIALGTNPKAFREKGNLFDTTLFFPNGAERNRSGVYHWGFGMESVNPDYIAWCNERGLPYEHGFHVHTYFNTFEVKLRGTGDWIKLMHHGHLTVLDDPEIRELAERYGDPDDLLREDWVPAIPGINYPGDYMRDYGQDPASWIRRELEGRLPQTIGVPTY